MLIFLLLTTLVALDLDEFALVFRIAQKRLSIELKFHLVYEQRAEIFNAFHHLSQAQRLLLRGHSLEVLDDGLLHALDDVLVDVVCQGKLGGPDLRTLELLELRNLQRIFVVFKVRVHADVQRNQNEVNDLLPDRLVFGIFSQILACAL